MSKPYISVIVTAYNRTQFIHQAIRSVLEQTLDRDAYEIIVVCNFALDPRYISSQHIKVISCDEAGLGIKIKLGLESSSGEVISILEDDDYWEPERLAFVSHLFQTRPDVGLFHNWFRLVDGNGLQLKTSFRSAVTKRLDAIKSYELDPNSTTYPKIRLGISYSMDFYSSSMSFRREIVSGRESVLGTISSSTDVFYFYSCLTSRLKLLAISERLTNYRIHSSNISVGGSNVKEFIEKKSRYCIAVANDYRTILKMISGQFHPAAARAVKWRISGTELESIWLSSELSRGHLMGAMANYLKYISLSTLKYDMSVLAYSLLYFVKPDSARRLYLKRYYDN